MLRCRVSSVMTLRSTIDGALAVVAVVESDFLKDPEVQLMLRVKSGDDEAFTELVDRYRDRLVPLIANMIGGDAGAAEGVAQDVFLRIYRARNGYQPTARFSTWVFRITNNLVSNTLRSRGKRKEVPLSPEKSGPLGMNPQEKVLAEKSGLMPSRQLDKAELQKLVLGAIEGLNENQRMAILLHKFEGMSYAEIADVMEISREAVKSLLSRARDNLRARLEPFVR